MGGRVIETLRVNPAVEIKVSDVESTGLRFQHYVRDLQDRITAELQRLDPGVRITEDPWTRVDHNGDEGGGGRTRALLGDVIENAGVNVSCVYGEMDPAFAAKISGQGSTRLWATGLSLIIHPRSPRIPTVHANFRMIRVGERYWFGGGADLTPFYPHEEDFRHFHRTWATACRPYGCFESMKRACDDYFVNRHRDGEMRGVGGIFFDQYKTEDLSADYAMVTDLAEHFLPSWVPIVERRVGESWDAADEEFQLHRRGRYVEFNLLHDRGTKFGLDTRGRTDSILISLPARCRFTYCYAPVAGGPHAQMSTYYRPHDWVQTGED